MLVCRILLTDFFPHVKSHIDNNGSYCLPCLSLNMFSRQWQDLVCLCEILPQFSSSSLKSWWQIYRSYCRWYAGRQNHLPPPVWYRLPYKLSHCTHSLPWLLMLFFFTASEEENWLHVTVASFFPWMILIDGTHFKIKTDQFQMINLVPNGVGRVDYIVGRDVRSCSAGHHEACDLFTQRRQ